MNILAFLLLLHSTMCEYDRRVITSLKYSTYRVKPTIVNGDPVGVDTVPYVVSIKEPKGRLSMNEILWANLCGGSIIGVRKVLTAAHCFEGNNFFYRNNPHLLRVFAGSNKTFEAHSGASSTGNQVQVRRIVYVVLNRNFYFPANDIALVFTDEDWVFNDNVDFVVTAKRMSNYEHCVAVGFGQIGHGPFTTDSEVLLAARVNVLSALRCSMLWEMNMNFYLCTDNALGDVARGDSGGPLACLVTNDPEQLPGKELLVGVVSGKNFDKTSLFTRVSAYRDWIESNVACRLAPALFTIILLVLIYTLFLLSQLIADRLCRTSLEIIASPQDTEGY